MQRTSHSIDKERYMQCYFSSSPFFCLYCSSLMCLLLSPTFQKKKLTFKVLVSCHKELFATSISPHILHINNIYALLRWTTLSKPIVTCLGSLSQSKSFSKYSRLTLKTITLYSCSQSICLYGRRCYLQVDRVTPMQLQCIPTKHLITQRLLKHLIRI